MRSFRPLGLFLLLLLAVPGLSEQELIQVTRQTRPPSEWNTFVRIVDYDGTPYVSLVQVAALLNGQLRSDKKGDVFSLALNGKNIRLFSNSSQVSIAGRNTALESPTVKNSEGFWVPFNFFASGSFVTATRTKLEYPRPEPKSTSSPSAPVGDPVALDKAARPPLTIRGGDGNVVNPLKAKALRRIIVDPGHGGKDPGAIGRSGAMEKDINLRMALELAESLRETYGYEVLLTRMEDTFITLEERPRLANKHNGDLFISLHCNASPSRKRQGFEVYFLSERASDSNADAAARLENAVLSLEGKEVPSPNRVKQVLRSLEITANINEASVAGALIDKHLGERLSEPSLGVKQAAFYVLRGAEMPAVLVEMAFISNSQEEKMLQSASFRKKVVEGVGAGIAAYDLRKQKERS